MAAGRKAAQSIMEYLGDKPPVESAKKDTGDHLNRFNPGFLGKVPRASVQPPVPVSLNLAAEEAETLSWEELEHEANRCFNCGCVASSPSDLAPALMALKAQIKTTRRLMAAEDFFRATLGGSTVLEPGELVEEVQVPPLPEGTRQAFLKFRIRKSIDFPIVDVATVLRLASGRVFEARIVLGAVAPIPLRAVQAESYLCGRELSEKTAAEAARLAVAECIPLRRNQYKAEVLRALVKRALCSQEEGCS
jgi:hypothetical protein